jgi:hypothetical protein
MDELPHVDLEGWWASICVDDERPPYAFVTVRGPVEISRDPAELLAFATAIGGRYMGAEQAERFGRRNAVEGELVVRLRAERVFAMRGIAELSAGGERRAAGCPGRRRSSRG